MRISILVQIAEEQGGLIDSGTARQAGISRAALFALCKAEKLCRVAKGYYILPDAIQDELLLLYRRSPKIVFSHETALFLHGLSDRTPDMPTFTSAAGNMPSEQLRSECRVYYVQKKYLEYGRIMLPSCAGNLIPVYNLERTVCDVLRSRNRLDPELVTAALRRYAARPDKDLNQLYRLAGTFRVITPLSRYMEVLL